MSIPFIKGLHKISESAYAYLQPDGSWGLNNAGIIVSGNEALLVDTLYDYQHTAEMLSAIEQELGKDLKIKYLVNTHSNGDHYFGNALVKGAEIIAARACAQDMEKVLPKTMVLFSNLCWLLGTAGKYFRESFKAFNFKHITLSLPQTLFSDQMQLNVGKHTVDLFEVKGAHTNSDTMVYLKEEKVLFASDLLFIEGTPLMWAGPVANWVNALDRILAMDVTTIIPGHGPATDKNGVVKVKEYFTYIYAETKKRFDRKMGILEAALDIDLKEFASWGESERIACNIATIYHELDPAMKPLKPIALFGLMGKYKKKKLK